MRKSKEKTKKRVIKKEQPQETLASENAASEAVQETPVALAQEETPTVTAPEPKHRGRKPKSESPETEQAAPKRTRKAKVGKIAAELSPFKRKGKDKTDIPANAEETILLQYGGQELNVAELREKILASYVEAGHRKGRISKLNLYIKPEDRKVYYVINDKTSGSIDF
jgi:hypothetical protein